MTEELDWEKMAEALWDLLDNISTLGDQYHPEPTPYVRAVDRLCEQRGRYLESLDGHTLVRSAPEKMPRNCTGCGVLHEGVAIVVGYHQWLCSSCADAKGGAGEE